MMNMQQVGEAAGRHPYVTGAAVFVGGLGALWWFGFFGSSRAAQASAQGNGVAAAYYQAEAAQTQAGAAVQLATLQYGAQTSQAKSYADAATSINLANDNTQVQLASYGYQTADSNAKYASATALGQAGYAAQTAQTQAAYGYQTVATQTAGAVQLGTVQSNNSVAMSKQQGADALATAQVNGAYAAQVAKLGADANEYAALAGSGVPLELIKRFGAYNVTLPNQQTASAAGPLPIPGTPTYYEAVGYTPDQALVLASHTVAGQFNPSF